MMFRAVWAVLEREIIRMIRQRTRLIASMIRPLIWLFVIGAGIGSMLDYSGEGSYTHFLIPGVLGMTILFGSMLSALTTVYDKESGVMRMMIVAPLPHYWIIIAKTLSSTLASVLQAILLLIILTLLGMMASGSNYILLSVAIILSSLACSGIGMLTASFSKSLDNFAAVMNFVIFPIFFISGSLYPVHDLPYVLSLLAQFNPYTYAVDLLKHALSSPLPSSDFNLILDIVILALFVVFATAISSWRFAKETNHEPLIKRITASTR